MGKRLRLALFGSFYRGYYVLYELLNGELKDIVEVVGVASDDPKQFFVSPSKRVWQYPHTREEETLVPDSARYAGLEVFLGRVKTDEFYAIYEQSWKPNLCISATFGQLFNERIFDYPDIGFLNLHPSFDDTWPSYSGGNPFSAMISDRKPHCVITIHRVNQKFDEGELVARTRRIAIPNVATVTDMHKITSPIAADLVKDVIKNYLSTGKLVMIN
ncbi:formyltransferase family protein [Halobacteriota archaeon]